MQLKGYARSESTKLNIDSKYKGKSVNKTVKINYSLGNGAKVILAAYGLPFCFSFVAVVAIFAYVLRVSLDEFEMLVKGSPLVQANIVAVMLLCVIITG